MMVPKLDIVVACLPTNTFIRGIRLPLHGRRWHGQARCPYVVTDFPCLVDEDTLKPSLCSLATLDVHALVSLLFPFYHVYILHHFGPL